MSYTESRKGHWFVNSARSVVGAVMFFAAGCGPSPAPPSEEVTSPAAAPAPTPFATRVPFVEGPLNPEVLARVQQSVVRLIGSPKAGYQHYEFSVFHCNGFIIKDGQATPLVVTTRHCFPDRAKSEAEDKTYPTTDGEGRYIFDLKVEDSQRKVSTVLPNNLYIGEDRAKLPDVVLFNIVNPAFKVPALELSLETPPKWATLHRVSHEKEKVNNHPFQFLEEKDGRLRLLGIVESGAACFPGTSGSPIVNNRGEVVGVVAGYREEIMDENHTNNWGLGRELIGRKYYICEAENANRIKGLIRIP